jgi:site-specific DNA-methyltransferase (adenine-specific)
MKITEKVYDKLPLEYKKHFTKLINHSKEEVLQNFPYTKSSYRPVFENKSYKYNESKNLKMGGGQVSFQYNDEGSASRFFYCAKASQEERSMGLYDNNEKQNFHPTVKPLKLMRYLCKLITPKNGVILDPFMGSGTTGMSAILENFNFIGIEKEKEYFELSNQRIKYVKDNKEKFDFYEEKKEKNVIKKIKEKDLNVVDFIF